jgi:hypothetical protein
VALFGSGQKERSYVRSRDEQQQPHRAEEDQQHRANVADQMGGRGR